jgi:hypothetical protein
MENPAGTVIGIDTGGTFTDAAVLDIATHRVVRTAKSPTTHHDLGLGIDAVLRHVLAGGEVDVSAVKLVALSTTLATNAVVEDRGARVGLFMIGPTTYSDLPVTAVHYVKGGHKWSGEEEDPLDIEAIIEGVESFRGEVDAYALCAVLSVVSPTHELVASKAIEFADPKPVFCSHRVSSRFGMRERAATAVLCARLLPVMREFLAGVAVSLRSHGLGVEVRIVRGDGSVMPLAGAEEWAAFTVASGPAASGQHHTAPVRRAQDRERPCRPPGPCWRPSGARVLDRRHVGAPPGPLGPGSDVGSRRAARCGRAVTRTRSDDGPGGPTRAGLEPDRDGGHRASPGRCGCCPRSRVHPDRCTPRAR